MKKVFQYLLIALEKLIKWARYSAIAVFVFKAVMYLVKWLEKRWRNR